MKHHFSAILLIGLSGCASGLPLGPQFTDNRTGFLGCNAIASYYDRNSDGNPDKWIRGDILYLDSNFDGKIDYSSVTKGDMHNAFIDKDYDGYFDVNRYGGGFAGTFEEQGVHTPVVVFPPLNAARSGAQHPVGVGL